MFLKAGRGPRIFSSQLDIYIKEITESSLGQVISYPDTYISWFYSFPPGKIGIVHQLREGADKSLARPGRKQATGTKFGIYSTYSPRSSIHFLARCSNFCKPLKKNQNVVCPTRSPRKQWCVRSVLLVAIYCERFGGSWSE